jgi:hypothetical protein
MSYEYINVYSRPIRSDERAGEKCWYLSYANGKERARLTNKHQREKKKFSFFFSLHSSVSGDM